MDEHLTLLLRELGGVHGEVIGDDTCVVIVPLLFHVALLVNPTLCGGYDDRYCISSKELAFRAIKEFKATGRWRFWQKHWNENVSIQGTYAYRSGTFMIPENALYEVDWDADRLRDQYPHNRVFRGGY